MITLIGCSGSASTDAMLLKPFTVKFRHTLRPGWELMEYICNENNQDVEHIRGPAGL